MYIVFLKHEFSYHTFIVFQIGKNVIITENPKKNKKRFKKNKKNAEKSDSQMTLEGNQKLNNCIKIQQKKSKKDKIRLGMYIFSPSIIDCYKKF